MPVFSRFFPSLFEILQYSADKCFELKYPFELTTLGSAGGVKTTIHTTYLFIYLVFGHAPGIRIAYLILKLGRVDNITKSW